MFFFFFFFLLLLFFFLFFQIKNFLNDDICKQLNTDFFTPDFVVLTCC